MGGPVFQWKKWKPRGIPSRKRQSKDCSRLSNPIGAPMGMGPTKGPVSGLDLAQPKVQPVKIPDMPAVKKILKKQPWFTWSCNLPDLKHPRKKCQAVNRKGEPVNPIKGANQAIVQRAADGHWNGHAQKLQSKDNPQVVVSFSKSQGRITKKLV